MSLPSLSLALVPIMLFVTLIMTVAGSEIAPSLSWIVYVKVGGVTYERLFGVMATSKKLLVTEAPLYMSTPLVSKE